MEAKKKIDGLKKKKGVPKMKRLWVGLITILGITIVQGASISSSVINGTTGEPLRFATVVAENLTHPLRS